jgi:formiminoglutamase
VLGGGHEAALGHYLGYVEAGGNVGIINIDAHLDVRPLIDGRGHSGSPFRQALEHPTAALPGWAYVCLGAQPFSIAREHLSYVRKRDSVVVWCSELAGNLDNAFSDQCARLHREGRVYLTIDADAVCSAVVPGVSAPNPTGLAGDEVAKGAFLAGTSSAVSSIDLVEINPRFDSDGSSVRWGRR